MPTHARTALAAVPLLLGTLFLTGCLAIQSEPLAQSIGVGSSYRNADDTGSLPPPGDWWKDFEDATLDQLMDQFESCSPSLDAALARREQVWAELGISEASLFPSIRGDASAKRRRDSKNGLFVPEPATYSQFEAALNLEYEIDLWGRVRDRINAAHADYQASAGDAEAAILSLKASLARNWYQLRYVEEEIAVVRRTVKLRDDNRKLIQVRVDEGDATDLDLARAKAETETARAQLIELQRSREQFFNALAAIVGKTPAKFTLPPRDSRIATPHFPPGGVPCELLCRRPDVYAARERVHAATDRIGVTRKNYLPSFTLGGRGGLSSLELSDLLDPRSLFGSIGPDISIPIFQAGRSKSDIARAEAEAREAFALYRETVLNAVRDVETYLSDSIWLDRQITALDQAAKASTKAADLSRDRYEEGLVSLLEVIDADRVALTAKREWIRARAARQLAAIRGVQALGGGWGLKCEAECDSP